jgi:hypothetical protein
VELPTKKAINQVSERIALFHGSGPEEDFLVTSARVVTQIKEFVSSVM